MGDRAPKPGSLTRKVPRVSIRPFSGDSYKATIISREDVADFMLAQLWRTYQDACDQLLSKPGLCRLSCMNFGECTFRDCMKSSWRSPEGGSSVAKHRNIALWGRYLRLVSFLSTPIRSLHSLHALR